MATPSLPSTPPAFPPLNPAPLGNGQAPDLSALLGGAPQAPGQAPNPLQQNGPQLPPPPPAAGVGGNFQQFA